MNDKFWIYQIRSDLDEERNFRFASMHELTAQGLSVNKANYTLVYSAPLDCQLDVQAILDKIFYDFNDNQPADFTGRSLSVSDVIVLRHKGKMSAHYVDTTCFVALENLEFGGIDS